MPFRLAEYDDAFAEFVAATVRDMARARDPVLGMIPFEQTEGAVGSRIQDREGMDVDLPPTEASFEMSTTVEAVRNGDITAFTLEVDRASGQFAEQLMKHWLETMDKVTEATGNVVDAGGKKLTFEMFYEMLDQLEWTVDDDDNVVMPALVMHPDMVKNLPAETEETKAKVQELLDRKRREAIARRRRRRLS